MKATAPTSERELPTPVRVELRSLADDRIEGRVSSAEYDRLVEELLVAIGVPVAEAED